MISGESETWSSWGSWGLEAGSWKPEVPTGAVMQARFKLFSSAIKPWEDLCEEAAAFATEVGRDRLINISVSAAGGQNFFGTGAEGVIYVWYWE
jgi:hypothetical protein